MAETQPQLLTGRIEIVGDDFLHIHILAQLTKSDRAKIVAASI
jgi:hypothetical protein